MPVGSPGLLVEGEGGSTGCVEGIRSSGALGACSSGRAAEVDGR